MKGVFRLTCFSLWVCYLEDSFGSSGKKTASLTPECGGTAINTYTENSYSYQNSYIFSGNRKMEINKVSVKPRLYNFEIWAEE